MQKKSLGRGLEDITDIFISQQKDRIPANDSIWEDKIKVDDGPLSGKLENTTEDCGSACEITEHITINKNLAYSNTPDVQESIVNSLFKYLRQNYKIKKIELAKVSRVSKPGMTNTIQENIFICMQAETKNGNQGGEKIK